MKQSLFRTLNRRSPVVILVAVFVALAAPSYANHIPNEPSALVVTRNQSSKKHKVRLFTASDSQTVLFTVDGVTGNQYTIFVFDLEGKLVAESAIKNHQTSILPELRSGGYLYEVFVLDQKVENGLLTVKKN